MIFLRNTIPKHGHQSPQSPCYRVLLSCSQLPATKTHRPRRWPVAEMLVQADGEVGSKNQDDSLELGYLEDIPI